MGWLSSRELGIVAGDSRTLLDRTGPQRRCAVTQARSWDDLPAVVRREVAEAAKRGRRHADPDVARLAFAWARTASGPMVKELPSVVFAAVSGLFGDSGGPQMAGEDYRRRRLANRIMLLGEPGPTS
jgi:hypothetical protein